MKIPSKTFKQQNKMHYTIHRWLYIQVGFWFQTTIWQGSNLTHSSIIIRSVFQGSEKKSSDLYFKGRGKEKFRSEKITADSKKKNSQSKPLKYRYDIVLTNGTVQV